MNAVSATYTAEEKARIEAELDRLLANIHFANSRRFPSFLRFVVDEELAGRGDQLKERTLGTEVFGRPATYDTTSDPIVRVTAAEIRKRIAQYYQEHGATSQVRISLPPGSYVPHFEWPAAAPEPASAPPVTEPVSTALAALTTDPSRIPAPAGAEPSRTGLFRKGLFATVALLVLLAGGSYAWFAHGSTSALDAFWAPVLNSTDPVTICFPEAHLNGITLRQASDPGQQHQLAESMSAVIVDDLSPLVSLAGLVELHHQRYSLLGEDAASLTSLRQGPSIFVGAFDNAWTLRLTRGLRFQFANDPDMKHFWIEDTQSPEHTRWGVDRHQQEATNNYRDYALVARFQDPSTGRPAVIAAGIARGGTVAAGEFLTQESNLEMLRARAPRNWQGRNLELVLSTEIIDGRSAPPRIEAVHFW